MDLGEFLEYLGIPTRDYTLTPEEFAYLIHPDDRQSVFDALTLQLDGNLYEAPVEYRLRRDDGSWEWFEAERSPLPYCRHLYEHSEIQGYRRLFERSPA